MTLNTNIKTTTHYNLDCANGLWEICDCGAHGAWEENQYGKKRVWTIKCGECGLDYAEFLEYFMTDEMIDEAQEDNN